MAQVKYLVPARGGSTGFPGKNAVLLPFVWKMFPEFHSYSCAISSDDENLLATAPEKVTRIRRPEHLATNEAGMDDVMRHAAEVLELDPDDILVTLYPTYIDRTIQEVHDVVHFLKKREADHVLCAKPIDAEVYMTFQWTENYQAKPTIKHEYYRRQDYPTCFESCPLVIATRVCYLPMLGPRLYTPETLFFPLDRKPIDVDNLSDFVEWARTCE